MKTGPDLLAEICEEVTIDRFLDRNPHSKPYTEEELEVFVLEQREARLHFEEKASKRKEPKE